MFEIKVKACKNLSQKIKGLIGAEKPYAVLINTRFGIHTFGVKFPIDVLVVDKDNQVVKVYENMRPNRLFFWNPIYNKVLELPLGKIKKNNIEIGTQLKIIEE